MPRSVRKKSVTDTYHVMLRGIDRQVIFRDEEDYLRFLKVLSECKQLCGFELFAYCLMPNHIHLLLRVRSEPLDLVFRRLGSRFVYWYNLKYERVGHLFQDRYRSEPVEDDAYFLTVLRYILQNPMKGGLEGAPGSWPYSSYGCYKGEEDFLTDTAFARGFFASSSALLAYLNQKNEDRSMDIRPPAVRISDEKAAEIAIKTTCCPTPDAFRKLDKHIQREYAIQLRHANLSIAQISRVTGMPATTVARITKMVEGTVPTTTFK